MRFTASQLLNRAWFVLVVAFINALTPVASSSAAAQSGSLLAEVCTSAGLKKIALDQDGAPLEPAAGNAHGGTCVLCGASAPALPNAACLQTVFDAPESYAPTLSKSYAPLSARAYTPPATGPPTHA
jgi:hypothetical protein